MDVASIYRKHYRRLMLIPILLFIILLFFLPSLRLGIDFTGGISIAFEGEAKNPDRIAEALKTSFNVAEVSVIPVSGGLIVEMSYPPILEKVYDLLDRWKSGDRTALEELRQYIGDVNDVDEGVAAFAEKVKEEIIEKIKEVVPGAKNFVVQEVVPVLGQDFWNLMKNIALAAVFLLLIAVVIYFRHPIPVIIMLLSALFDGIAMLALMGLTNIPLTLSTMAIVLMMVGYSIDTDVVASTFVFKRRKEGDVFKQAERAFKTGVTMSLTTLIAMIIIYAVGFLTRNLTVIRIANVMIYGLLADIIITWLFNTPLLILVGERHA